MSAGLEQISETKKVAKILEFLQRVSLKNQPDSTNEFAIEAIFHLGANFDWNVNEAVKFYEEAYHPEHLVIQESDPKALMKEYTSYVGILETNYLNKVKYNLGFENVDVSELVINLDEIEYPEP